MARSNDGTPVTASTTASQALIDGGPAYKIHVTNRGSEDLLINVPNVHGLSFVTVASGETEYFSVGEQDGRGNPKTITNFNHKTKQNTTTFDWGVVEGIA